MEHNKDYVAGPLSRMSAENFDSRPSGTSCFLSYYPSVTVTPAALQHWQKNIVQRRPLDVGLTEFNTANRIGHEIRESPPSLR